MWSQELDVMILMGPIQQRHSTILVILFPQVAFSELCYQEKLLRRGDYMGFFSKKLVWILEIRP